MYNCKLYNKAKPQWILAERPKMTQAAYSSFSRSAFLVDYKIVLLFFKL